MTELVRFYNKVRYNKLLLKDIKIKNKYLEPVVNTRCYLNARRFNAILTLQILSNIKYLEI